jgi:hypothetical protein
MVPLELHLSSCTGSLEEKEGNKRSPKMEVVPLLI